MKPKYHIRNGSAELAERREALGAYDHRHCYDEIDAKALGLRCLS